MRVKYLLHVAKTWAKWTGKAAALQYDKEFEGCDHDIRDRHSSNHRTGKKARVNIPDEARVLRKFPWASRSLGSIEYVSELHHQGIKAAEEDVVLSQATRASKAARLNMVGARYDDSFINLTLAENSPKPGRRVYTQQNREVDQPLPQEDE